MQREQLFTGILRKKKAHFENEHEDESDEFFSQCKDEVEDEAEPMKNNGLPAIESYEGLLRSQRNIPLMLVEQVVSPFYSLGNDNASESEGAISAGRSL